jgi:hypothetical protein
MLLQTAYEPVAWRWSELSGVYFFCKLEEWTGVFAKVADVKHGLWVWKIREIYSKPSIHTIS